MTNFFHSEDFILFWNCVANWKFSPLCNCSLLLLSPSPSHSPSSIYSVHWIWSSSKILSSSFIGKRVECEKPTSLCHLLNPLHTLKYKLLISIAQLITGINGHVWLTPGTWNSNWIPGILSGDKQLSGA